MAASAVMVPVEEYLRSSYAPDCEYLDGYVEERAVGEFDHASWQAALVRFFGMKEKEWGIRVRPELRVQVAARRYRVPDVTLLSRANPVEQVVTYPPLAVFEILSPEDSMMRTLEKLEEYEQMGVGAIWVIDPSQGVCYRYTSGHLATASLFVLPGTGQTAEMREVASLVD